MRRALLAAALTSALAPATAAAAPEVVAHRGGALANSEPAFAENTLPAFENAAEEGWVLEFDVHLTKDGVPVVIHDDTLDRVSNCTGLVKDMTAQELRDGCWIDRLGRPDEGPSAPNPEHTPIPTLAEVLALAAAYGATVSPEIKNIPPTSPAQLASNDFDPNPDGFAAKVSQALADSGFPQQRMIVQSFWPPNLEVARRALPDAQLSFLTIGEMNDLGPEYATANGYGWVSPEFGSGLNPTYVERAHAEGRLVTVYTPNSEADIGAAIGAGVDAVITDDPVLGQRLVRQQQRPAGRGASRRAAG